MILIKFSLDSAHITGLGQPGTVVKTLADTHCEEVGPAFGLLPDRRRGVGSGRDIDPELLLAGAWGRRD